MQMNFVRWLRKFNQKAQELNEIATEQKNLAAVMAVNLDAFWQRKKPDGNQAQK